jgi:predicted transglutaminase-like cysteine proteinase
MFRVEFTSPQKAMLALAGACFALVLSGTASATEIYSKPSMKVLGAARAPIGHAEFCVRQPSECVRTGAKTARVALDSERLSQLIQINDFANRTVEPVTDIDLYGKAEYWTYPGNKGDCEDYVLLKQRLLIKAGWDASVLLITVVRDEKGDGHAVLTVATDKGDLVLDNQRDVVLAWQDTGYEYIKRQSQTDPKSWVFVGPAAPDVGVATAR